MSTCFYRTKWHAMNSIVRRDMLLFKKYVFQSRDERERERETFAQSCHFHQLFVSLHFVFIDRFM